MDEFKPPVRIAALAGVAVFALYVLTLAPSTAFWDTSEYIATAWGLGIPHPPGNPLFVVWGRTWALLLSPLGLSPAVRLNLFAAATSAVAAGFWFLVAWRVLSRVVGDRRVVLIGAGLSTLVSATAFTVWNQSNVNEKVYTVSVMIVAIVSWLALRWADRRDAPGSERYLLAALYLIVLGTTNHLMSALPAPALGLFVLLVSPAVLLKPSVWLRAVPLVLLGLSFNFFLPIRAAEDPVINEGEPTCESWSGAAVAVFSNGRSGCPALAANLRREQYAKPPVTERMAPFGAQFLNYFQYFDWQWGRGMDSTSHPASSRLPVTLLFLGLGAGGLWVTWRSDRNTFAYLGTLAATLSLGLVFYLNFKYGYSLNPEVTNPAAHEVRERDYFFVASFAVWGMLSGLGIVGIWKFLAERVESSRAYLVSAPILLVGLIPLFLNFSWASRAGDWAARDWAFDLLMSVEPYGVLFTNGDNDTFPLWYAQEVEGIRKDVTVVVVQYLQTSWYPRQLQRLTEPERQRAFESEQAMGVYEVSPAAPANSITSVSPEEMDGVGASRVGQDMTFRMGNFAVAYPAGTVLDRGQVLALAIIRDSIEDRPIYFASTAGLMASLGLTEWAVRHGLAVKLVPGAPSVDGEGSNDVVPIPPNLGGGRMDVRRSLALANEVYQYRGLENREIWADRATLNIPLQYYIMFIQLANAAGAAGQEAQVIGQLQSRAEGFLETYETGQPGA